MDRRAFLGTLGAAISAGLLGRRALAVDDPLVVRVWTSERAAAHDEVGERVRGYLRAALEPAVGAVEVQLAADRVALPREDGRAVLARRWPRLVLEGAGGLRGIDPVGGVNLLVTDGDPTSRPAGFARPHVAASTGAAAISRMDPAAETPPTVPYSVPAAATQLLLHECGHALGLDHDHGAAYEADGAVVATPMVSSYLWASESVREKYLRPAANVCGDRYPPADADGERQLHLRYAECVHDTMRTARD